MFIITERNIVNMDNVVEVGKWQRRDGKFEVSAFYACNDNGDSYSTISICDTEDEALAIIGKISQALTAEQHILRLN